MKILHLTQKDFSLGNWSGGSTAQLYIYPENGDYATRQFALRISSATVRIPESDFTPLTGVERWITPLTGGFTLTHPGAHPVVMRPMDAPYRFSGGIPTHCVGEATDFNLMLKGITGEMAICRETAPVLPGLNAYYPVEEMTLAMDGQIWPMNAGELLVIFAEEENRLNLTEGALIRCYGNI
ncbi:MAG: HutD family protein [Ruminococcaceae bacterium]|nr:HutD family protein [Oscillospiraceae bacterium]